MDEELRNLKFAATRKLDRSYWDVVAGFAQENPLYETGVGYVTNMERVVALAEFAALAIGLSVQNILELEAKLDPRYVPYLKKYPHLLAAATGSAGAFVEPLEPRLTQRPTSSISPTPVQQIEQFLNTAIDTGYEVLPAWAQAHPVVNRGMESLLSAMLTGAWTAFEVLAEGVWVSTLNARPRLGFIAMNAEPEPEDDDRTAEKKANIKFTFPAWRLRDPTFDLRTQMGTVLADKWDFARRDRALDAYRKAFTDNVTDVTTIFENRSLGWLAAARNALVHDAGIVTREFTKLVKGHPHLSLVEENQPIPVDGELVVELTNAAVVQSKALLEFVDHWLKNNPT